MTGGTAIPPMAYLPPMPLPPIVGHQDARSRLAEAVRSGRLPQVLVISGPAGVGKQRLALWLAQLVLCERRDPEPCGRCRPCRLVDGLAFADLHWFVPIPRPKAADPDKATEEAALAIAEVMEERRTRPRYGPADGMASHSMASVRLLHQRASLTSVEGGARIFILGDADRLVPQESSQEAANALLKLLEEPPAGSLFLLTTVDPRRLLPTIRSRAVPVRLQRLADAEVRASWRKPSLPCPQRPWTRGWLPPTARSARRSPAVRRPVELTRLPTSCSRPCWRGRARSTSGRSNSRRTRPAASSPRCSMRLADTLGEAARGVLGQPTRRPVPPDLLRRGNPASLLRGHGPGGRCARGGVRQREPADPARRPRRGAG